MFGSRTLEQALICDAMCWWNDVIVIVVIRSGKEKEQLKSSSKCYKLAAYPYWQLNKDSRTIMDPVPIPFSSSSSSRNSGIRISCNKNTIVVSCTSEIVTFTLTSQGKEPWRYKCRNRLFLSPKFVVCGAYDHVCHMLCSESKNSRTKGKMLWYRKGSSLNRIKSLELETGTSREHVEMMDRKVRPALVRVASSISSEIKKNTVLIDDGLSSFDLRWSSSHEKFNSLWSFGDGEIVMRSLGTRNDFESRRSYVKTDEWPLAMKLPTYDALFVVPVIQNDECFDFRIRSRSCLPTILYELLVLDIGDKFVRCILSRANTKKIIASALTNVMSRAAKSRNFNILIRVRKVTDLYFFCTDSFLFYPVFLLITFFQYTFRFILYSPHKYNRTRIQIKNLLAELNIEDSYKWFVISATYQCHVDVLSFLMPSDDNKSYVLRRWFEDSITMSNRAINTFLFFDHNLEIAVKCLAILKRLRFDSNKVVKTPRHGLIGSHSFLYAHHSDNISLLLNAFSIGDVVVACETWNLLSRIENECEPFHDKMVLCETATCVASHIETNLLLKPDDLSLVAMWISCTRVPDTCLSRRSKNSCSSYSFTLSECNRVYSRLRSLSVIVSRVVEVSRIDAIVNFLRESHYHHLAFLFALVLNSSENISRLRI